MSHKAETAFVPLNIAVLTVSDTRTLETDTSGQLFVDRLTEAGHNLAARVLLKDDLYRIRAQVATWIAEDSVQVVLITGGTGFTGRHENRLDIQVAPLGPRRADQTYLIGQPRGQRIAIRLAAHRYRGNAQCLRGADDAHGDLAAIGHQQLVQSLVHGVLLR